MLLIKNVAGKNDDKIYSIIEKLTPINLNKIEKDFINTMYFREDIVFFKKYYVPLFNPRDRDIKNFLLFYFNTGWHKIKKDRYSYGESNTFIPSFNDSFDVISNKADKQLFANYCVKTLLSYISNNFWEYNLLAWVNKLYFNELDLMMHIIYPETERRIEKEKDLLNPIIFGKLPTITSKEIDLFNQIIINGENIFGNMKDVVFSILLKHPKFRKLYITNKLN